MRKLLVLILCSWLLILTSCQKQIVILFDNDVHCAVEGYAHVAMLRDSILKHTPYVAVVSAGDFVQGNVLGSLSRGESIISIMNAVPYDVVTVGNHEFDYTIPQQLNLMDSLSADVVCCNFAYTGIMNREDNRQIYPAYVMREYGRTKVAFIGVATPTTFATSTPTYFCDSLGNPVYSFFEDNTFGLVQQAAADAREAGADYVIVLSHLGDDTMPYDAPAMIASTIGIDAVLDGHSHHVWNKRVANAMGDSIIYASTGTKFQYVGELIIDPKKGIEVQLLPSVAQCDDLKFKEEVVTVINKEQTALDTKVSRKVGYTPFLLTDSDAEGERLVRYQETNLMDFIADACRYVGKTDIGCIHGGSVRTSIQEGDITYGALVGVMPFNNIIARAHISGQQLLDALEVSVAIWPVENGDFHIFSGLRYTISSSIPSSVEFDEHHLFTKIGKTRRVVHVEVEKNGQWKPLDCKADYTISGLDYTILNNGGSGLFRDATDKECLYIRDVDVLEEYIHSLGDTIPESYRQSRQNFMHD